MLLSSCSEREGQVILETAAVLANPTGWLRHLRTVGEAEGIE